jgi:alpha-1,2-rhamnosyltransferase
MFKRLIIDCTHTLRTGLKTGVQRVVRRICEESCQTSGSLFDKCVPVVNDETSFRRLSCTPTASNPSASLQILPHTSVDILSQTPAWYRYSMGRVCSVVGSQKLRKWFLPEPGHFGIFKYPMRLARRVSPPLQLEVNPSAGDLLLLPDAYWAYPQIWPTVDASRARGAKTASILYDLIPLTHSEYFDQSGVDAFRKYLAEMLQRTDVLLTISETVAEQARDLIPGILNRSYLNTPIIPFRLGAEFPVGESNSRAELRPLLNPKDGILPFLMVGTIEIRKNHITALRAMELVWQRHPKAKLLIAGRLGHRGDDFIKAAHKHPEFGKRLFLYHDLTDSEIDTCYRACRAVIFPSTIEGFGLPIVEALYRGCPVVASDIPIHREVGGHHCQYFQLGNEDHLAGMLQSLLESEATPSHYECKQASTKHVVTWKDSVKALHKGLERSFSRDREPVASVDGPLRSPVRSSNSTVTA